MSEASLESDSTSSNQTNTSASPDTKKGNGNLEKPEETNTSLTPDTNVNPEPPVEQDSKGISDDDDVNEPNLSSLFKENRAETSYKLKKPGPVPALTFSEEIVRDDVEKIYEYVLTKGQFVIIYGEAYVDEVSLATVIRMDEVYKQEVAQQEEYFRDINNDLILDQPADDLISLLDKEIRSSDTVRVILSLGKHRKLSELLLTKSYIEKLHKVVSSKEAFLLLCIQQDKNPLPAEISRTLEGLDFAYYVNWPSILTQFWQDRIQLIHTTQTFLLDAIEHAIQRYPEKSPRAAISLSAEQLNEIENQEDQYKSEYLKKLITKAFSNSQESEAIKLQQLVEQGWQKPLKKYLLALYSLMSKKQPVSYQQLKGWGTFLLRGSEVRYPVLQQESTEFKSYQKASFEQPLSTTQTNLQYIDAKAEVLWLQYFDELLDECHIAIDRDEKHGLILNAADANIEWLVGLYYRRYPGSVREIFDNLINSDLLFPEPAEDEQSHIATINKSYKVARLLVCVHSLDAQEYPIGEVLTFILNRGVEQIYKRVYNEQIMQQRQLSKRKERSIWNLVAMGIAYYLQEIRDNVASLEDYKKLLDEAYIQATKNHAIARLLLNAFGFLFDQERFATLDYLFQFLDSDHNDEQSGELWATLRRVFAYHMSDSLNDRLAVLRRLSQQVPDREEPNIIIMTYSRLWFDAIRNDYRDISVNTEGTFASLFERCDIELSMEFFQHYKRVDQALVALSFLNHRAIARDIANMMLSGFPKKSSSELRPILNKVRDELADTLFLYFTEKIQEKLEIFQDFYDRPSPATRLHRFYTFSQTKDGDSFVQTGMSIYRRFFAVALAEWGSSAAGIYLENSPKESKDTLTCYLNAVSDSFSADYILEIGSSWRETAKDLESIERKTNPPEGAISYYSVSYGELKSLLRKKINRYRKMAEYLMNLNEKKQNKDLTQ